MIGSLRAAAPLLLVGLACAGAARQGADPRGRVRALAEAGRLPEAEAAARAGGASLAVPLGEVLLLRGRLAAAESSFRAAMSAGLPDRRSAEAALAELAERRGDHGDARRRAEALAAQYERDGARWSAEDKTAAARAYVVLGAGDPPSVREALRALDAAISADSGAMEPRIRLGDLFLDRYNAPDAKATYELALRFAPNQPRVLLGLARVAIFEGSGDAEAMVRRSLAANPALVQAQVLLGQMFLDAEEYDSAAAAGARAVAIDSAAVEAWALLGATAWLRGDSAGFSRAHEQARRATPKPEGFYSAIGEAAAHHRRYAEAAAFGRQGIVLDSTVPRALGVAGINELRLGDIAQARAHLERAFALDPYHVWYKNTLDLLDQLRGFRTVETRRFRIVAPAQQADLLAGYLGPLLEEAYDSLAARYGYRPTPPIRIELYDRHADFSVRTAGLTGIGALGVSFGNVLAMDAPSARDVGSFNWGSTAWHELTHAFTLGLSAHRVPRWFSEGLSVLEERRAQPGWGAGPSVEFLATFKGGRLLPVSRLNEGFVRPSHPAELGFSYYQASLLCEMIEATWGPKALVAMLAGYRDGLDTPRVFRSVLSLTPDQLVNRFDAWLKDRFRIPLGAIAPWDGKGPPGGEFVELLRAGRSQAEQGHPAEARAALERAAALFPGYAGPDAPALGLARLARERGDLRGAAEALARHNALDESAYAANADEAALREQLGDVAGAAAALERMIWISPYEAGLHTRLGGLADRLADLPRALRERRAAIAAGPADVLEARYQLARALFRAGDAAGARREILQVLEAAPGFEKAQALLLELRGKAPDGRKR